MSSFLWLIGVLAVVNQVFADCVTEIAEAKPHDTRDICSKRANWALIPHPHDCHKFFVCANYIPEEFNCEENYYFDTTELRCKLGSCTATKKCQAWFRRVEGDCTAFENCINGIYERNYCPAGHYYDDAKTLCVAIEHTPQHQCGCIMPPYAVLKNPTNCESYYVCVDGRAVLHQCPRGQYFDERINTCLADLKGVCLKAPTMTPDESAALEICNRLGLNDVSMGGDGISFLPDANDCTKFYMCVNGRAVAKHCPLGFYYDRELHFCEVDRNGGACQAMRIQLHKKLEQQESETLEKEKDKQHLNGDSELNLSGVHDKETKPSNSLSLSMTHVKVDVEKDAAETTHNTGSGSIHVNVPEHIVEDNELKTEKYENVHDGKRPSGELELGLTGTHDQEVKPPSDLSLSMTHVKVGVEKEAGETTHNSVHVNAPEHVAEDNERRIESHEKEYIHNSKNPSGERELELTGTHDQESKPHSNLSLSMTHIKVGVENEPGQTTHNTGNADLHVNVPNHKVVDDGNKAEETHEHKHEKPTGNLDLEHEDTHDEGIKKANNHLPLLTHIIADLEKEHGESTHTSASAELVQNHGQHTGELELTVTGERDEETKPKVDLSLSLTHINANVEKNAAESTHNSGALDLHIDVPEHHFMVAVPANEIEVAAKEEESAHSIEMKLPLSEALNSDVKLPTKNTYDKLASKFMNF